MKNYLILNKGTSGAGKSTRTKALIKFLMLKSKYEIFYFKGKSLGYYFKDLNLLVIGNLFTKNNKELFQGYDSKTGLLGGSDGLTDFIKENIQKHNIIIEGAGTTATFRLRPLFLYDVCKVDKIFIQYYQFQPQQKEEYMQRIFKRTGKMPGEQMWRKNQTFLNEYQRSLDEEKNYKGSFSNVLEDSWDAPLADFGLKVLILLNKGELLNPFMQYSIKNEKELKNE